MIVDLVYLWVDGNDPQWMAKRNVFKENVEDNSESTGKGRFVSNDELKYSLRSAEKYAPWIRKIYIVTDNQIPEWLDTTNPKIKIIDHKNIIPEDCLPCFNSTVIEYFIYKIPDLSEHFLYANDDMFFGATVSPDYFFYKDEYPIIRLTRKIFGKLRIKYKTLKGKKFTIYRKKIINSSFLVEKMFGKYYSGIPHHNIDAYKKSDYQTAIEKIFNNYVKSSKYHRFRNVEDLHRSIISYYVLAINHGHIKYVNKKDSIRIAVNNLNFLEILKKYKSQLFCINDDQYVSDNDRKRIKPSLEELFPEKSALEK